ncbi:hypothetical protein DFJ73DRAFT_801663 [Zopfochytrium polystomum]|nr:hypothetical protein DFJ73DRAFT_801663 [Zopfochytrium polystomum]
MLERALVFTAAPFHDDVPKTCSRRKTRSRRNSPGDGEPEQEADDDDDDDDYDEEGLANPPPHQQLLSQRVLASLLRRGIILTRNAHPENHLESILLVNQRDINDGPAPQPSHLGGRRIAREKLTKTAKTAKNAAVDDVLRTFPPTQLTTRFPAAPLPPAPRSVHAAHVRPPTVPPVHAPVRILPNPLLGGDVPPPTNHQDTKRDQRDASNACLLAEDPSSYGYGLFYLPPHVPPPPLLHPSGRAHEIRVCRDTALSPGNSDPEAHGTTAEPVVHASPLPVSVKAAEDEKLVDACSLANLGSLSLSCVADGEVECCVFTPGGENVQTQKPH